MGTVEDFSNFINAVIDERSFNKIQSYLEKAKQDPKAEIWVGGECDKSKGYFVQPTVIEAKDPLYVTMCEEIFGPVLTVYIYQPGEFEKTLELVNSTSPYALTGSIISLNQPPVGQMTVIDPFAKQLEFFPVGIELWIHGVFPIVGGSVKCRYMKLEIFS